jgi:hypothetical protein
VTSRSGERLLGIGVWLFRLLVGRANSDAIWGDIQERFSRGRSWTWLCKEIGAAIAAALRIWFLHRRQQMVKRGLTAAVLATGMFILGFWTAQSPYVIHEEMPSAEVAARMKRDMQDLKELRAARAREFAYVFLKKTFEKAEAKYAASPTPEAKSRVDQLRSRLQEVERLKSTRVE